MSSGAYDRVKPQVDELERRFYALLDACDEYADLLQELIDEWSADADSDAIAAEMVRRLRHQRGETAELTGTLEDDAMQPLLRIKDRVLMVKHTEEGDFV